MGTVVVCDDKASADAIRTEFDENGTTVQFTAADTPSEVIEVATDADGLIVDANTPVTRAVIEALDLAVVGRAGIGYDNVDVTAAEEAGVIVTNVPDYCLDEVSSHAVALLLACARRLPQYDRSTRDGAWDWTAGQPLQRLRGHTVGFLAFGDLARRTATKLSGFDIELIAHDPYVSADDMAAYDADSVALGALFDRADHLSIHAPLTEETRGVVDETALASLPSHAILVNTGRGAVIDTEALADALDRDGIAAAGLDVLPTEPPDDSRLVGHDRAIVTPHSAWYSEDSRIDLGRTVASDVARVLRDEDPNHPVSPDDW